MFVVAFLYFCYRSNILAYIFFFNLTAVAPFNFMYKIFNPIQELDNRGRDDEAGPEVIYIRIKAWADLIIFQQVHVNAPYATGLLKQE